MFVLGKSTNKARILSLISIEVLIEGITTLSLNDQPVGHAGNMTAGSEAASWTNYTGFTVENVRGQKFL